jgi:pimeloyl-ACP methyl ester carboxylesterase
VASGSAEKGIGESGTVVSRDGAAINFLTLGSGPSVIVVPGALSTAAGYTRFGQALAAHFSVHIIERRGRGRSPAQDSDYSMRAECDDVIALQRETGASLLVGHSFGGLVALETARNNPALAKMAVYEPGVSIDHSIGMDWMPGYQEKLAANRPLDAFIEYSLATGPDRARRTPRWLMKLLLPFFLSASDRRTMLGLLPQNLREHQQIERLDSSYQHYREISAEVLLMRGGKTGISWVTLAMDRLHAVLPRSETTEFPSLDHFGIDKKDPQSVADVVAAFFRRSAA